MARSAAPATLDRRGTGREALTGTNRTDAALLAKATRPAADVLLGLDNTSPRISSEQRNKATRDPLVQRVKEAFEGTIVNVNARPRVSPDSGQDEQVESGEAGEGGGEDGEE